MYNFKSGVKINLVLKQNHQPPKLNLYTYTDLQL